MFQTNYIELIMLASSFLNRNNFLPNTVLILKHTLLVNRLIYTTNWNISGVVFWNKLSNKQRLSMRQQCSQV